MNLEWNLYIRKEPFLALRAKDDMSFNDKNDNMIYVKKSYYICRLKDNSHIWIMHPKTFHAVYKKLIPKAETNIDWLPYIERQPIEAIQLNKDFILNKPDVKLQGKKGDYLCRDLDKINMWITSNLLFTFTYKPYKLPRT